MSKYRDSTGIENERPARLGQMDACDPTESAHDSDGTLGGPNVVVKRERLFGLLQEEHLKERLVARDDAGQSEAHSAGIFRLYGSEPIPEVNSMDAENSDPTSLGVVTFKS